MAQTTDDVAKLLHFYIRRSAAGKSVRSSAGLAVGSVRGPVREDNQDRAAVTYLASPHREPLLVGLICDGMGGMVDGAAAATIAASQFVASLALLQGEVDEAGLLGAVDAANRAVFDKYRGEGGTTLTALVILQTGPTWIVHIGDSRLYSSTDSEGLQLLTKDDTIAGIAGGAGANEDDLDNRLLQFVGIGPSIEPHLLFLEQVRNRKFLLTTDGAHSLGRKLLEGTGAGAPRAVDWVERLMEVADAANVQDNATAIAISLADFAAPPALGGGVSIKFWTPFDTFELWLQSQVNPIISGDPAPREHPTKQEIPKARKPRTKPAISTNKVKQPKTKRASPRPQLSIKFNEGEN